MLEFAAIRNENSTLVDHGIPMAKKKAAKTKAAKKKAAKKKTVKKKAAKKKKVAAEEGEEGAVCLLYTSPSPRDQRGSRMPSSA